MYIQTHGLLFEFLLKNGHHIIQLLGKHLLIWFVFFSSIVSLSSYPPLFIFAYSSSNAFIPFLSVGLCICRLRVEESPVEDIYGTSRPTGWLLPRSAPWSPSRSSDFRGWPSSCFRPAWWGCRCYHRRLHYHYYRYLHLHLRSPPC